MILRYLSHAKEYGFKRLLTGSDIILALVISVSSYFSTLYFCPKGILIFKCNTSNSILFVENSVGILAPITSVILTGLAILVSFTGGEFLARIKDMEGTVFLNILFVFEHTVFLSLLTTIVGVLLTSYQFSSFLFYSFVFLFSYTIFSVIYLIQLLVNMGINKSEYEWEKHFGSDE